MLRKVVLGSGVFALIPVVKAAKPIENEPAKPSLVMKPSDLPIYDSPLAEYAENEKKLSKQRRVTSIHALLLEPVHTMRVAVQEVFEKTDSVFQFFKNNFNDIQVKSDWIVTYLREEENKEVRFGAVAMGGLTGFIFGLRGGFIRRLVYASLGTSLMGVICFPEETKEIYSQNSARAKQYVNIAYNFAYGDYGYDPNEIDDRMTNAWMTA